MESKLFNDSDERYTELAVSIENEIIQAIEPVLKKYRESVKIRDMQILAANAVEMLILEMLIDKISNNR